MKNAFLLALSLISIPAFAEDQNAWNEAFPEYSDSNSHKIVPLVIGLAEIGASGALSVLSWKQAELAAKSGSYPREFAEFQKWEKQHPEFQLAIEQKRAVLEEMASLRSRLAKAEFWANGSHLDLERIEEIKTLISEAKGRSLSAIIEAKPAEAAFQKELESLSPKKFPTIRENLTTIYLDPRELAAGEVRVNNEVRNAIRLSQGGAPKWLYRGAPVLGLLVIADGAIRVITQFQNRDAGAFPLVGLITANGSIDSLEE